MKEELIAPCGMNCGVCSSYLAATYDVKSQGIRMPCCSGCRPRNKQCAFLKKKCQLLLNGQVEFCYQCPDFPCNQLRKIDTRYKTLYRMSFIENLKYIKEKGLKKFLDREREKWRCPECGETICCHNGICFHCGLDKLRTREKRYRWDDT